MGRVGGRRVGRCGLGKECLEVENLRETGAERIAIFLFLSFSASLLNFTLLTYPFQTLRRARLSSLFISE